LTGIFFLGGCAEELPPTSVEEFMTDRALLDSTLALCNADKAAAMEDRNCSNARRAVERLWRQQEEEKKAAAEREFQRKREALRAQANREQEQLEEQRKVREALEKEEEIYGGVSFEQAITPAAVGGETADAGETEGQATVASEPAHDTAVAGQDALQAVQDELAKRREAAAQSGEAQAPAAKPDPGQR